MKIKSQVIQRSQNGFRVNRLVKGPTYCAFYYNFLRKLGSRALYSFFIDGISGACNGFSCLQDIWFHQHGAPPHKGRQLREEFPDLSPLDYFIRGQ